MNRRKMKEKYEKLDKELMAEMDKALEIRQKNFNLDVIVKYEMLARLRGLVLDVLRDLDEGKK